MENKLTLVELQGAVLNSVPPLSKESLDTAQNEIRAFLESTFDTDEPNSNYWALINWKTRYITIFHANYDKPELLSDIFMEVITKLGTVKAIDINKEMNSIEIWITNDEGETNCYIFFNYNDGVIEGDLG